MDREKPREGGTEENKSSQLFEIKVQGIRIITGVAASPSPSLLQVVYYYVCSPYSKHHDRAQFNRMPLPPCQGHRDATFFFHLPPSASLAMDVQTHSKVVRLITDMCTYMLRTGIQGEVPSQRFKLIRMLDIPKLHTFSLTNKFIQRILIANLDC